MSSPVDIKAVLDAMGAAEEARNQPVRVHVYIEDEARDDIKALAYATTKAQADNATVLYDTYPPQHAMPDAAADLALLVAHDGARTGALYANLQSLGVPTAVYTIDREGLRNAAKEAGHPLADKDVFGPSAARNASALSDRSDDSQIGLETTAATDILNSFGRWVVEVFKEKRVAFAHAFSCVRRPLALESVNATAMQNAGIGVVAIIPGADMPLMTLNQLKMLLEIAAAYGEELSMSRLKEILAVVGGAFAFRGAARQLVGMVPVAGWLVKGGIGYAGTIAEGHALLQYFESGAHVGAAAKSAAEKVKNAPSWAGVSASNGLAENVQATAGAVKDLIGKASKNLSTNVIPAATELAKSAGDATGFAKEDLLNAATSVVGNFLKRGK